jgi:hypothetical protein
VKEGKKMPGEILTSNRLFLINEVFGKKFTFLEKSLHGKDLTSNRLVYK